MRFTIFRAAAALMAIITPSIVTAANPLQIHAHVNERTTLSPRGTFAHWEGNTTDIIIHTEVPRLIIYYQTTHDTSGKPISMLPLVTEKNIALTHLIVCSLHISKDGNITLNDHPPTDPRYGTLWQETQILSYAGVKIMGMIGGAAAGSFTQDTLDSADETVFNRYYGQLHETIKRYGLQGLDIDVEQPMSQGGVERLILRLRADFGKSFIITLAPVASALTLNGWNLSGFDYRKLMLAPSGAGKEVAFYNCQFYSGFGDAANPNQFHQIITDNAQRDMRGSLAPTQVVIGQLTNPRNGGGFVNAGTLANSIKSLRNTYGQVGGVAGWEYFNGQPGGVEEPWKWAQTMTAILRPNQVPKLKMTTEMASKLKDVWKESAAAGIKQVPGEVKAQGFEPTVDYMAMVNA